MNIDTGILLNGLVIS